MKRVMCIVKGKWINRSGFPLAPSFGDYCTVISETNDGVAYVLKEFPHQNGPMFGWHKSGFILLSEIDETNFQRQYNKELV